MPLPQSHPDFWTEALQFTPTIHRDVYPSLQVQGENLQGNADGKIIIITGAGSGFGEGACRQWAAAGAKAILLSGRSRSSLVRVAETLKLHSANTVVFPCDVSLPEDVDSLFSYAITTFGRIDVVVHCAGVLGPLDNIGDAPVEDWMTAFDINLKGTFLVARALARCAKGDPASFIHVGTAASYFPAAGQSPYTASKAASNMIIAQLHIEYSNLRVFNVHPGMAKSPVLRKELEVYAQDTALTIIESKVELFGSFSVYLAGNSADFLRGRFVAVNWDVDELEKHQEEIIEQNLLSAQPFKGDIGPGGHRFKQDPLV